MIRVISMLYANWFSNSTVYLGNKHPEILPNNQLHTSTIFFFLNTQFSYNDVLMSYMLCCLGSDMILVSYMDTGMVYNIF
jgi:hypothetical protein